MVAATVFGKIISIFIMMMVGAICYKLDMIDNNTKEKLSRLSTLVVSPLLILMSFQMEYDAALLKNMGILFALAIFSFGLSILLAHFLLREKAGYDTAVEKFAAAYNNCGFMGMPLAYAFFGSVGVIYATVFVAAFHIFCWTHGIMLMDEGGFKLKKLVNPCLIAVAAGLFCFVLQLRIPENIAFALDAIADMNTPLAMLVSGAIMVQLDLKKALTKGRIFFVAFIRLIVSPVIFCLLLRLLPIDEQMRTVAAMTAACPSGAMTITMAIMYHRDDRYATELFTASTLLSLVTLPLCMLIAG